MMRLTSYNLLSISIALLLSTTSTYEVTATYQWKICHSQQHHDTPPSQWDNDTYRKLCFLHRNDTTSTPGTALFQHWLADYTYNSTGSTKGTKGEKRFEGAHFDFF